MNLKPKWWDFMWELGFLSPKAKIWHKPHFFLFFKLYFQKSQCIWQKTNKKTPQSSTPQSTAFIKVTGVQKKIKYHRHITYTRMKKLAFPSLRSLGNLPQAATEVWKCNFTGFPLVIFTIKTTIYPCSNLPGEWQLLKSTHFNFCSQKVHVNVSVATCALFFFWPKLITVLCNFEKES